MPTLLERLRQALAPTYEVERELGTGGMGSVFLARDLKLNRDVAIKVLRPDLASAPAAERFIREARVVASLKHPNVVPIYQAGEVNGLSYFVMEYVEGETLAQRLERGTLSGEELLSLAVDLLSALQAAHETGIVHRDVKPANIFLVGGRALLGDFGIAKRTEESGERLTASGHAVGTPAYMAPEQLAGGEVTPATDVYAVGAVLYEASTGRRWSAFTPVSVGDWSRVPSVLVRPLQTALHTSPEDRWRDAGVFRDSLLETRAKAHAHRRAVLFGLGAVLGLAAVVGGALLLRGWLEPSQVYAVEDPRQSYMILPFMVTADDPALDWLGEGAANLLCLGLGSWREIRVVERRRLQALAESEGISLAEEISLDKALELARAGRVGTLLLGEAVGHAGSVDVVTYFYDVASGELIQDPVRVSGPAIDVRPLLDSVVTAALGLSGAPVGALDLRAITTQSLDAYRKYLKGHEHLRRWELANATERFRAAAAADSTFALAYHYLAMSLMWQGRQRVSELTASAVRHCTGLPDRHRQHILALDAVAHGDFDFARRAYNELIRLDSTDVEAWFMLGDVEFHDTSLVRNATGQFVPRADWGKALAAFLQAVELDAAFHLGYGHAFDIYQEIIDGACRYFNAPPQALSVQADEVERRGYWNADSSLIGPDSAGEILQMRFCPRWQGSVVWRLAEGSETPDSIASALRMRAIAFVRRWSRAAPDLARPHEILTDLYLNERRHRVGKGSNEQITEELLSDALIEQKALFRLTPDTSPDKILRLASLFLANRLVDSAAVLVEGLPDSSMPMFAREIKNVYMAKGQPHKALAVLGDRGVVGGIYIPQFRVTFTESERDLLAKLVVLGSSGGYRTEIEQALDSLINLWPISRADDDLADEESEFVLRLLIFVEAEVALPVLGPETVRKLVARYGEDTVPTHWRAYLALHSDSIAAAANALDLAVATDVRTGMGIGLKLFLLAEVAYDLGRDSLAVELLNRLDTHVPGMFLDLLDSDWALLSRSYFRLGEAYERLGDEKKAAYYYELFRQVWRDAEPDLQYLNEEARTALARLHN